MTSTERLAWAAERISNLNPAIDQQEIFDAVQVIVDVAVKRAIVAMEHGVIIVPAKL